MVVSYGLKKTKAEIKHYTSVGTGLKSRVVGAVNMFWSQGLILTQSVFTNSISI